MIAIKKMKWESRSEVGSSRNKIIGSLRKAWSFISETLGDFGRRRRVEVDMRFFMPIFFMQKKNASSSPRWLRDPLHLLLSLAHPQRPHRHSHDPWRHLLVVQWGWRLPEEELRKI
jgi:hypothetical protein